MDSRSDPQAAGTVLENGLRGSAVSPTAPSPSALFRSVFREERFFLILSVFIGIFSGLAVVCFRFAIDWCRIYLLGSAPQTCRFASCLRPAWLGW